MSTKLVVAAAVVIATISGGASAASLSASDEVAFANFVKTHGRVYKSAEETAIRKTAFEANMRRAAEMQARNPLATFGANALADRTREELDSLAAGSVEFFRAASKRKAAAEPVADLDLPAAAPKIDWREKGLVPEIRDMGGCVGHWAFAAVSNIESAVAKAKNATTIVPLSEQELISCVTDNAACRGGFVDRAFDFLVSERGGWISTHESYPYESYWGTAPACKDTNSSNVTKGAKITGFKDLPQNETQIAQFVSANHPIAVGIDITSVELYFGGIVTNCFSREANVAMNIVGYDDVHNPPYWILRNAYGNMWGEQGYLRIEKGTNQCLVQEHATTAIVA